MSLFVVSSGADVAYAQLEFVCSVAVTLVLS